MLNLDNHICFELFNINLHFKKQQQYYVHSLTIKSFRFSLETRFMVKLIKEGIGGKLPVVIYSM